MFDQERISGANQIAVGEFIFWIGQIFMIKII